MNTQHETCCLRALSWPEIQALYRSRMQEDFPQAELKPLAQLQRFFEEGLLRGYSLDQGSRQGLAYALLEAPQDGGVWLLDYLAVDKTQRGHGWGSRCLELLPEQLQGIKAVVLEIERLDSAVGEAEAQLRRKRKAFYLHNGVQETGVFASAFGVDYEILALPVGGRLSAEEAAQAMERLYPRFFSREQFAVYRPAE